MKKEADPAEDDEIVRTQIRYPNDVYWALQRVRRHSGRSLNAEVIFRLRQSLALDAEALDGPPADEREAVARSLERLVGKVQEFSDLLGDARDRLEELPEKK